MALVIARLVAILLGVVTIIVIENREAIWKEFWAGKTHFQNQ